MLAQLFTVLFITTFNQTGIVNTAVFLCKYCSASKLQEQFELASAKNSYLRLLAPQLRLKITGNDEKIVVGGEVIKSCFTMLQY